MTNIPCVLVTRTERRRIVSRGRWKKVRGWIAVALWAAVALLGARQVDSGARVPVAAVTGLAAVTLLIGWGVAVRLRRSEAGLLQACLLVSMLAHVALGSAMGSWMIVQSYVDPAPQPVQESMLDGDTLALERLVVRMREEVAPAVGVQPAPAARPAETIPDEAVPSAGPAIRFDVSPPTAVPKPGAAVALGAPPIALEEAPVQDRSRERSSPAPFLLPPARSRGEPGPGQPIPAARSAPAATASASTPSLPPLLPGKEMTLEPGGGPPPAFVLRNPEHRASVLEKLGTDKKTEEAVARALRWLAREQAGDGRWGTLAANGRVGAHDIAATSLAMLAFYGWGARHDQDGPYRKTLAKGLAWLLTQEGKNGDLTGGRSSGMYDHGMATLCLAEAYGITRDPALRAPLQRAVELIVRSQNDHGGWRYRPGSKDGDTSVTGWQMMALRAAELAGIEVPDRVWTRAHEWLDWVGSGPHKGLYGYNNPTPRPAMVAQGMYGQGLHGAPAADHRMKESAAYLAETLPDPHRPNHYYWYCGSLALHQFGGPAWAKWNARLKEVLVAAQVREEDGSASWPPRGEYAVSSGRVVITALATLSLEVYYRYLPLR